MLPFAKAIPSQNSLSIPICLPQRQKIRVQKSGSAVCKEATQAGWLLHCKKGRKRRGPQQDQAQASGVFPSLFAANEIRLLHCYRKARSSSMHLLGTPERSAWPFGSSKLAPGDFKIPGWVGFHRHRTSLEYYDQALFACPHYILSQTYQSAKAFMLPLHTHLLPVCADRHRTFRSFARQLDGCLPHLAL